MKKPCRIYEKAKIIKSIAQLYNDLDEYKKLFEEDDHEQFLIRGCLGGIEHSLHCLTLPESSNFQDLH
jgi:hypothetical protein